MNFRDFSPLSIDTLGDIDTLGEENTLFFHKGIDPTIRTFLEKRLTCVECEGSNGVAWLSLEYPNGSGAMTHTNVKTGLYVIMVNGRIRLGVQVTNDLKIFLTEMD